VGLGHPVPRLIPQQSQKRPAATARRFFFACKILWPGAAFWGSEHAREEGDSVDGTGFAGVRGRARSHRWSGWLVSLSWILSGF